MGDSARWRWAEWKLGGRDGRECMSDAVVRVADDDVRTDEPHSRAPAK